MPTRTSRFAPRHSIERVFANSRARVRAADTGSIAPPDGRVDVHERGGQEVPDPELPDEVGDGRQLDVAGLAEALDHDLLHRPRAVHQRQQLDLAGLEPIVQEIPRVGDHRVVVAPPERELLYLDVGRELGPELGGIDPLGELSPQARRVLRLRRHGHGRAERRVEPAPRRRPAQVDLEPRSASRRRRIAS